jgi:tetratricopeptide (TPR) repeat protein
MGHETQAYYLRRARYGERLGNAAEAAQDRVAAASVPPTSALDHFLLGDDLRGRGELAAAAHQFEQALRVEPGHFWARYFLAVSTLLTEPRVAKAHLTSCLRDRRDFAEGWVYLLRGIAHAWLDEYPEAETDFEEALRRQGTNADFRYAVLVNGGVLAMRQGRRDEAVADFSQIFAGVGHPFAGLAPRQPTALMERAAVAFRQAAELKPEQFQGSWGLARLHQHSQQLSASVEEFDRAITKAERLRETGQLERPTLVQLYRQRSQLHRQRGDQAAALGDCDQALRLKPSAEDHAERGRILYQCQRYDEAVAAYDAALALQPHYVEIYRWRAEALLKQENYWGAADGLDRYLAQGGRPGCDFYQLRGWTWAKLNHFAEALEDFDRALALRPDSHTHALRGWLNLVERRAPQIALDDFQAALRLDPQNSDAYNGRGFARVSLGQYRAATEDAQMALRLGPRDPRSLYKAARIYAQAVGRLDDEERQGKQPPSWQRATYEKQAVHCLRQALVESPAPERASLLRDLARRTDRAFDPIRPSPAFDRLAAEFAN